MKDFAKSIMTGNASGIKEFNTEADLRRWCIEHQYAYTPTHGGYYRLEDDKPGRNRPDLEAHVKAGNKKVGNGLKEELKKRHKDPMIDDIKASATIEAIKKEPWKVYDIVGVGDSTIREYVFDLIEEKYNIAYDDIYEAWLGRSWDKAVQKKSSEDAKKLAQKLGLRFGNSKVGNSDAEELEKLKERLKSLKKDGGERGFGMTPIMYRDTIQKIKELEKKIKTGNAKFGNSKVGNADIVKDGNVWVVLYAEGTKSKEFDSEAEAKRFAAQVGNSDREFFKKLADDAKKEEKKDDKEIEKVVNSTWYEPRKMPFSPTSLKYAYEQAKKKGLTGRKLEAEMLRIAKTTPHSANATEQEMMHDVSEWVLHNGNPEDFVQNKRTGNSASDDKFAYVMREFDEGKLKTPDGKVVTDPAQAKAIAYSESKKTENGLARARNAMNKKTGNSPENTIIIKGKPGQYTYDIKSVTGGYLWGDEHCPGYFKTKEEAIRKALSNYPNSKVLNP